MSDDRSERLRRRRKRSSRQAAQSNGKSSDARENTDGAEATGSDDTEESDREKSESDRKKSGSVKEERTGTYMYLPDDQLKELKRLYNVLKAEYEFEFDEEFEKNRHFYPLVVQCGLDGLDEMDVSDVREKLKEV